MSEIIEESNNKCFNGWQKVFSHMSVECKCKMNFGVYLPPQAALRPVPVIYFLSGLTCTEANFIQKSGAQKYAAEHGVILVTPDTSPRGDEIPDDEAYDLGMGAGFYVNATREPWSKNYRMYNYVVKELPALINEKFPVLPGHQSIMGHSMGGHGALICALKNPGMYKTVSLLAPICHPVQSRIGIKIFSEYFGTDDAEKELWKEFDATYLIKKYSGPPFTVLMDQGNEDSFIKQLMPEKLIEAATNTEVKVVARFQEGYDHSYFFVSTFIGDHIKHHMEYLKN